MESGYCQPSRSVYRLFEAILSSIHSSPCLQRTSCLPSARTLFFIMFRLLPTAWNPAFGCILVLSVLLSLSIPGEASHARRKRVHTPMIATKRAQAAPLLSLHLPAPAPVDIGGDSGLPAGADTDILNSDFFQTDEFIDFAVNDSSTSNTTSSDDPTGFDDLGSLNASSPHASSPLATMAATTVATADASSLSDLDSRAVGTDTNDTLLYRFDVPIPNDSRKESFRLTLRKSTKSASVDAVVARLSALYLRHMMAKWLRLVYPQIKGSLGRYNALGRMTRVIEGPAGLKVEMTPVKSRVLQYTNLIKSIGFLWEQDLLGWGTFSVKIVSVDLDEDDNELTAPVNVGMLKVSQDPSAVSAQLATTPQAMPPTFATHDELRR